MTKKSKFKRVFLFVFKNLIYLLAVSSIFFCIHCNESELQSFIMCVVMVALQYIIVVAVIYLFIQLLYMMKDDFNLWVLFRKPEIDIKIKSPIIVKKQEKTKENK